MENNIVDRANKWLDETDFLTEEKGKSNWIVTVYDGSKKVESYTSKDKTEAEVSQECKDKIKGKKEMKAVYKKAQGKLKESVAKPTLPNPIQMDIYLEEFDDLVPAEVWYDYSPYDKRDVQPQEDLVINSVMIDGVERIKDIDASKVRDSLWELIRDNFAEQSERSEPEWEKPEVNESFIDKANKYLIG